MSVRIIAGKFRGMKVEAPNSARPTLGRHRQVIFDTLETIDRENIGCFFKNKIVIDCFAGSGALGIEAVSRGAKHAYLIDQNHQAVALLYNNTITISEYFTIIRTDTLRLRNSKQITCDIAFLDPPYGKISISKTVDHLTKNKWIDFTSWLVIEEDARLREEFPQCLVLCEKSIGNSVFIFAKLKRH